MRPRAGWVRSSVIEKGASGNGEANSKEECSKEECPRASHGRGGWPGPHKGPSGDNSESIRAIMIGEGKHVAGNGLGGIGVGVGPRGRGHVTERRRIVEQACYLRAQARL